MATRKSEREQGESLKFGIIMYQTSTSKGQELVAQRMTKELEAQGHKAVLITSRFHDFHPVISADAVRQNGGYVSYQDERLGITVYRVESRKVEWPPRRIEFNNFISILDRIIGELGLNVLVTHSTLWNGPELTALLVLWKRRMGTGPGEKRLVFCHMSHFQPPASSRYSVREREWRRAWNEYSLSRIIREADLLLVTTPAAERHMVEQGARREQCLLFPGGIEIPQPQGRSELDDFRRDHDMSPGQKLVTYLGTVERRKNVAAVVEVAKRLKGRRDVRFVVAGRMEGEYAKNVRAEADEAPNLTILGEVTDEEKSSLIRASYVNINMSELEALGIAQLEFMSVGVPVVTSGVGGQAWVVKNDHTGIVLRGPRDLDGASSAVVRLLEDPVYRARLGANAEKFASKYTMRVLVRKLALKIDEKLMARKESEVLAEEP